MTLTFELDLDKVKMNQLAKYLGHKGSKVADRLGHCMCLSGALPLPGH